MTEATGDHRHQRIRLIPGGWAVPPHAPVIEAAGDVVGLAIHAAQQDHGGNLSLAAMPSRPAHLGGLGRFQTITSVAPRLPQHVPFSPINDTCQSVHLAAGRLADLPRYDG
ncbi:MAG: hypothetical protein FJ276_00310 [Planctomycetes bacterium]|nr:hypothetical protein [Planctomycetota bacterium]